MSNEQVAEQKPSRKAQILQALATMLEASPGGRITTAALAKEVGVSEAALYRHFPSKAKMFEGLIAFIEESLFTRINQIKSQPLSAAEQVGDILTFLLMFAEHNPGITRILTGDAIIGENERLRTHIAQVFERLETQIKQILRDAEFNEQQRTQLTPTATANLLLAAVDGRISQYVRSNFKRNPTEHWEEQWTLLAASLYR